MEKLTLSDKIEIPYHSNITKVIHVEDVKQFIKDLKEELNVRHAICPGEIIDKLAGEKLI